MSARAGSGKTTTNIAGLEYTDEDSSVALVAFNRRIAREQAKRAPDHVRACTLHSLGFANIRAAWPKMDKDSVDNRKVWAIIFGLRDRTRSLDFADALDSDGATVVKLVSLCKATMRMPTLANLNWIANGTTSTRTATSGMSISPPGSRSRYVAYTRAKRELHFVR